MRSSALMKLATCLDKSILITNGSALVELHGDCGHNFSVTMAEVAPDTSVVCSLCAAASYIPSEHVERIHYAARLLKERSEPEVRRSLSRLAAAFGG